MAAIPDADGSHAGAHQFRLPEEMPPWPTNSGRIQDGTCRIAAQGRTRRWRPASARARRAVSRQPATRRWPPSGADRSPAPVRTSGWMRPSSRTGISAHHHLTTNRTPTTVAPSRASRRRLVIRLARRLLPWNCVVTETGRDWHPAKQPGGYGLSPRCAAEHVWMPASRLDRVGRY